MAVKPHSNTQRWICQWAFAVGDMGESNGGEGGVVIVAGTRRNARERYGFPHHLLWSGEVRSDSNRAHVTAFRAGCDAPSPNLTNPHLFAANLALATPHPRRTIACFRARQSAAVIVP